MQISSKRVQIKSTYELCKDGNIQIWMEGNIIFVMQIFNTKDSLLFLLDPMGTRIRVKKETESNVCTIMNLEDGLEAPIINITIIEDSWRRIACYFYLRNTQTTYKPRPNCPAIVQEMQEPIIGISEYYYHLSAKVTQIPLQRRTLQSMRNFAIECWGSVPGVGAYSEEHNATFYCFVSPFPQHGTTDLTGDAKIWIIDDCKGWKIDRTSDDGTLALMPEEPLKGDVNTGICTLYEITSTGTGGFAKLFKLFFVNRELGPAMLRPEWPKVVSFIRTGRVPIDLTTQMVNLLARRIQHLEAAIP